MHESTRGATQPRAGGRWLEPADTDEILSTQNESWMGTQQTQDYIMRSSCSSKISGGTVILGSWGFESYAGIVHLEKKKAESLPARARFKFDKEDINVTKSLLLLRNEIREAGVRVRVVCSVIEHHRGVFKRFAV